MSILGGMGIGLGMRMGLWRLSLIFESLTSTVGREKVEGMEIPRWIDDGC